jgi:hypothetical protein
VKDLIERLRAGAFPKGMGHWGDLHCEAADALERLTAGDVRLPRTFEDEADLERKMLDYGNRRAAAARKAMRDEAAMVCQLYGERTISKEGFDCAQAIRGIEP